MTIESLLVGDNRAFLGQYAPFAQMEEDALGFLCERLELVFFPRSTEILSPASGNVRYFYIVQQGLVIARQAGVAGDNGVLSLGPGEGFPIGAVSAQRPSTNVYSAAQDCYCYRLRATDFQALIDRSRVFQAFCTRYLASLLNQSRQQLQSTYAQRAAEQQTMTTPLAQLLRRAPAHLPPESTTREALELMHREHIGCVVITDPHTHPIGIFTQSDLLPRLLLPGADLQRPLCDVMTPAPHQLPATASAYDAALEMATHGVRHLLVVDHDGRLQGVLSERDLFSLQRISLQQIRSGIDGAHNIEALQHASQDIRQLALNLVAQGVAAEQLTQFISALNDALTRRILKLAIQEQAQALPRFCWLAFGSEGRHEQTLSTDQDNGILFDPAGEDLESCRRRLLDFARRVNQDLAACGFPLCKGNIMASNPELCLTYAEWQERFDCWIRTPDPQALLNATIFFDFRVLYGAEDSAQRLREWLNRNARDNPAFLRMMAVNALDVSPPLGRIRDFVLEADGCIDLKKSGARLFVDAARIFGLRTDVVSSSTARRLRESAEKLGVDAEEVAATVEGFHFIQLLRLRAQHLDHDHGAPGDNRIAPDDLNELDRRILKEALRQARKLQLRLKLDYQL